MRPFLIIVTALSMLNASMFQQGSKTIGFSVGSGTVEYHWPKGSENYSIIGISGSYFIVDNLSVGVAYRHWIGTPSLDEVTLPATYYLPLDATLRPYLGLFYRKIFIGNGYEDEDVYGARAGVTLKLSPQSYIGIGWVEEHLDRCRQRRDCSSGYPEAVIGFEF